MKKLFFIGLFFLPIIVYSTILHVPDEYASIQTAVYSHNEGDTILVAPGTYYENIVITGGKLTLASNFLLTNDSSYISQTILDGGGQDRVLLIGGSDWVSTFCGFTIRNGYTKEFGGGVCIIGASPIIRNCVITGNVADNDKKGGGGVACFTQWWGTTLPQFSDVVIENNSAVNGVGGGMYCDQVEITRSDRIVHAKLENVSFKNNTATKSGGGLACWGFSSVDLFQVQFIRNTVLIDGGGLIVDNTSECKLNNVLFSRNNCSSKGGAIYCRGKMSAENVIMRHNFAEYGGGMYSERDWHAKFNNILIENNYAKAIGGGIYFKSAFSPTLKNVTFSENRANQGTAIFCVDGSKIKLNSCILYGLMPQQIVFSDTGNTNTISINYTNIQGNIGFIETNDNGTIEWGEGNLNRNPMFVGSGEHPYQLNDNSWLIDAGDTDTTGLNNMTDLAGEPRLINDRVDMGAYEWNLMVGTSTRKQTSTPELIVFPNPFARSTTIAYELQEAQKVQISIYNQMGKQVYFTQENQSPGKQQVVWNAEGLPAGMYYYHIQIGNETAKGKMMVVR
jgi:predicted outer membrane repeat protein